MCVVEESGKIEISGLQAQLHDSNSNCNQMKAQISDLKNQIQNAEKRIDSLEKERSSLDESLQETKTSEVIFLVGTFLIIFSF